MNGKLLNSIQGMYDCVKSLVRCNSTLTDSFECPVGLKLGCLASPILFYLFNNDLAERIERKHTEVSSYSRIQLRFLFFSLRMILR